MFWWFIMSARLLMISAVFSSEPPAGINGWCMCKAIANALLVRVKSIEPCVQGVECLPPVRDVPSNVLSEPQISGKPLCVGVRLFINQARAERQGGARHA